MVKVVNTLLHLFHLGNFVCCSTAFYLKRGEK